MKAAVLLEVGGGLEVRDVRIRPPETREVLIKVHASGLCHSDYHCMVGDLPVTVPSVLGHEVSGMVESVGDAVTHVAAGDHVVVAVRPFCGRCDLCVSGKTQLCINPTASQGGSPRLTLDGNAVTQGAPGIGGFAEFVLVHENAAVPIPREMPLDLAALLGCGVTTGVGAVVNAARVSPGSTVLVVGCGGVGLNVVQGARLAGARQIIAVDHNPRKLDLARVLGATDVVAGTSASPGEVRAVTHSGVDYSFDVVGHAETTELALESLRPGGLLTMVGGTPAGVKIPVEMLSLTRNEWRIQGTYFGSSASTRDIPMLAGLYLGGRLDLESLVSHRIGLVEVNEAYTHLLAGDSVRDVVIFES